MVQIVKRVVDDVRTDYTWTRLGRLGREYAKQSPTAALHYVTDKAPVIGWLPRYDPRWIVNDVIAGLTIGLMLIPQALSYAKIATIPVEYGLSSSWLPPTIYTIMGSTKDLSSGPTSLLGLTTAEVVRSLTKDGYTSVQISSAVALCIGFYGIIFGFLNLGFLLEFISLPILSGFISAVAITIGLGQVASLLGEKGGSSSTAGQIHDIFAQLPAANGYACGVGFGGIVFLVILDQAGKRWGKEHKLIWLISITRAFLCLVLFTGISFAVNKGYGAETNRYIFSVVQVKANGIGKPELPSPTLISRAFPRSIVSFIGPILEHIAIARAFGVKNNYVSDQTQELCYFGTANLLNGILFPCMGVGGAMSRTSVNSACKVKSPLSGLVTTAVILVCIFKLSGVLYWIPKATLAAIIITAVWPLICSPVVFYRYWKSSLADFISSMLAFWVCLFVDTETGLGAAVGFNIVYVLLRQVFVRTKSISSGDEGELEDLERGSSVMPAFPAPIPDDVRIFRLQESFFFPNAYSIKTFILNAVKTHHAPAYNSVRGTESERTWSVQEERQVARLRAKMKVTDPSRLPPLNIVILDMAKCNHVDSSAVTHLKQLVTELRRYSGDQLHIRFAGVSDSVRTRFWRTGFAMLDVDEVARDDDSMALPQLFASTAHAIVAPRISHRAMVSEKTDMIEDIEVVDSPV